MNEMMTPYVWRQHREDMMREAERDRLARIMREDGKKRADRTFLLRWELGRMAGLLRKFFGRLESRKRARA
jgi:hypothetical protein